MLNFVAICKGINTSPVTSGRGSCLLTCTGHIAHLGCMAVTGYWVTPTDVGRFSNFVMLNFVAIRKGINTTPGTSEELIYLAHS